MGKYSASQAQYWKISVNTGLWLAVNVGTVQETIVNIGLWFAKINRIAAPFKVNILSLVLEISNIWEKKTCSYALDLAQIWPRDDTTYRIGSAPYKNVLHIPLACLV